MCVCFFRLEARSQQLGDAARSFSRVVSTVALIGRFRSRAQNRYVTFGQCFVEPVVRQSVHGKRYWSVLEDDNSKFLDGLGYYGKGTKLKANLRPVPVTKRSGWAAAKAAVGKTTCPVAEDQQTSPKKSPTVQVTGAAEDAKSPTPTTRSPRPSDIGSTDDPNSLFNIPGRFVSRRSSCSLPLPPLLKPIPLQPVLKPIPLQPVPRPHEEPADEDRRKTPTTAVKVPTIEINNNEVDPVRHHSTHSKFQWYQSSSFSSSTSTEELGSPTSSDGYVRQLEQIRAARRASLPDLDSDRLFVRVSSDAASTVSSQTLIEANEAFETDGVESGVPLKSPSASVEDTRQLSLPQVHLRQPDSFDIEEVGPSVFWQVLHTNI